MEDSQNENVTKKEHDKTVKNFTIAEIWGTLDNNQLYLVSYVSHTSLQKGRVMGKMEMDGKTAEEIGKKLGVEPELVQKALDEDPYDILNINEEEH